VEGWETSALQPPPRPTHTQQTARPQGELRRDAGARARLRVVGDQRVEEGVELRLGAGAGLAGFGAQDAAQALRLLAAGARVRGDLDQHVGLRDVQAVVAHLGQEDGVDVRVVLEGVQDAGALRVAGRAVDEGLPQLDRVLPQRKDVVREHDDLRCWFFGGVWRVWGGFWRVYGINITQSRAAGGAAAGRRRGGRAEGRQGQQRARYLVAPHALVVVHQELAGPELGGVHDVQQVAAALVAVVQVCAVPFFVVGVCGWWFQGFNGLVWVV